MTDVSIPKPRPITPTAPKGFRLSHHATKRAAEMRLTMNEIVALVDNPHVVAEHGATSKYHGTPTVMHMRGEHTTVLDVERRVVVTFLYRWRDGWQDNAELLGDGREVRPGSHLPARH